MNLKLLVKSLLVFIYMWAQSGEAQSVFINEIHYDNASTDIDEAIEIAGAAGTDLTGWSIALYSGPNSSVYNTISLSGTITDQQNGYGTVVEILPSNGLQNGPADGLALVDNNNAVVQFLSYEGVITAVDGPASGLTSTDIGVIESSTTPVGASLQLTGAGVSAGEFIWEAMDANTYGTVNTNQVFGTPVVIPVINEFVFNHTGSDTDEFVEVLAGTETDLSEYWLLEIEGDNNGLGTIDEVIQLGTADVNGYFTTTFGSNIFENGTVALLLVKNFTGTLGDDLDTNDDGVFDTTPWEEITDDVGVNDGGAGDLNYASVTLAQSFDGISFTVGGASRFPNGNDTDAVDDWTRNDFDGSGLPSFPVVAAEPGEAVNTPNRENVVIEDGGGEDPVVLINEIDADTEGSDMLEFVELYDGGAGNTSLDGHLLVFFNGSNNQSYATYDLTGFTTNANGYFVVGNTDVPGVSITFSGNFLQNGPDAVALYKAGASSFPNGALVTTDNLVDAIIYDTNDSDDAELLVLLNEGEPQVNEDEKGDKNFHSLQRFPNGSGGLRNTSTYTQAIATPGASNTNATEVVNLIINEIDADTQGSDVLEFVEIYDGGIGNTSLDGYVLVNYNGKNNTSYNAFDLDGFSTNPEGYFVIGNTNVANVNLVVPADSFQNGADAVVLYFGDATSFPNGTAIVTENIIDAVVYDTNDADDAELLVLLNAGQPQINEDANGNKDVESLQRAPNGQGGARNTDTYIVKTPTPGTDNDGVIVVPGEPISIAEARAVVEGTPVTIAGVLTVTDSFNGPAFLQDATGGIAVFDEQVQANAALKVGDSITLTGVRAAFNDQVQISGVIEVVNNGLPQNPIIPLEITLAQLANHPGELVRVANTSFPNPGDLLFGNSNFTLTDASGTGELRIDNDVESIVGKVQPITCPEVTGVVGRFREFFQLLPRQESDIPCSVEFIPPGDTVGFPKEDTFDVVAWNIEWFGDENNSPVGQNPMSDTIQRDSTATVLKRLNADVFAVEEIADDTLFAELVAQLPGYDYILSDATSNPGGNPPFQKVGFIYNTETVSVVNTRAMFTTIHPLYNGGDDSAITDYPNETSRFFASGRLPFLMTADVTINGVTERIDLIALHARANSGNDAQGRYDMRKYDVEVLKDSLDANFANNKLILLGDYNDDVDETVADIPSTTSSFQEYVDDTANYTIVSSDLSEAGLRSFVFRENMIDHIAITNELDEAYIKNSVTVHYEVYDSDYAFTTSDHFPVSARFLLEPEFVDNECVGASVTSFDQGPRRDGRRISRYRSNPARALGNPKERRFFNFVSLGFGGSITIELNNEIFDNKDANEFAVFESTGFFDNIPCQYYPESAEVFASLDGVEFVSLGTTCQDGEFDLSAGNLRSAKYIKVVDISDKNIFPWFADGYDLDAIVCLESGERIANKQNILLAENPTELESELLTKGFGLEEIQIAVTPNPVVDQLFVEFNTFVKSDIDITITNVTGQTVFAQTIRLNEGQSKLTVDMNRLPKGFYVVNAKDTQGSFGTVQKIIKQ
ncbi:T9SS type A sorting domain-containing protein [Aquimarina sp. MMG016]|uniref:T9SS type A sorting domain-containing protein n=1 Tax=Aquimarina sp. MMG016 TaxID=2822690 RepID=UPI001B3A6C74|nr:T9SS type A sorting domain-containing protein [Aquimarina sp. MMG016]MBQ4820021.1 T9SS type A sorting domain-containing protein [Aquimarina sp. MMG016]